MPRKLNICISSTRWGCWGLLWALLGLLGLLGAAGPAGPAVGSAGPAGPAVGSAGPAGGCWGLLGLLGALLGLLGLLGAAGPAGGCRACWGLGPGWRADAARGARRAGACSGPADPCRCRARPARPCRDDFPHTHINDVGFEAVRHPTTGQVRGARPLAARHTARRPARPPARLPCCSLRAPRRGLRPPCPTPPPPHALAPACLPARLPFPQVVYNVVIGGYFSVKRNIMSVPMGCSVTEEQLNPFVDALLRVFRCGAGRGGAGRGGAGRGGAGRGGAGRGGAGRGGAGRGGAGRGGGLLRCTGGRACGQQSGAGRGVQCCS
jgi:hypothetical protein